MNTIKDQERFVKMMKIVNKQRQYKREYGKDWRVVYEEDKANDFLLKDEN